MSKALKNINSWDDVKEKMHAKLVKEEIVYSRPSQRKVKPRLGLLYINDDDFKFKLLNTDIYQEGHHNPLDTKFIQDGFTVGSGMFKYTLFDQWAFKNGA